MMHRRPTYGDLLHRICALKREVQLHQQACNSLRQSEERYRRHMEVSLLREERRARRRGSQLGTIVIDVDHFKSFNDLHGHAAGDTVLRALGAFLIEHTRGEDIACRYGGEEFTLILPDASLESTHQRAEDLRQQLKEQLHTNNPRGQRNITISLGVAVFPEHGPSAKDALKSADMALYRAKAEGRDRVAIAARRSKESDPGGAAVSGKKPSAGCRIKGAPKRRGDGHAD